MRFAKDIYIDEAFEQDFSHIKRQIRYGHGKIDGYAIVMNENTGKLEAIAFSSLKQKYYRNKRQDILAVFKEYSSMAMYLAKDIVSKITGEEDPVIFWEEPSTEEAHAD